MANPAETYESFVVPHLFSPWADRMVEAAQPQAGERVLDIACGTGIVARKLLPHIGANGNVTGLDFNPNMLLVAQTIAERDRLSIHYHQGKADELPFPDANFDLVVCQQGLQFFPDRAAALKEAHRVLRSGGRMVISVWLDLSHHPFHEKLFNSIEHHLGASGAAAPFSLGSREQLHDLLTGAGFDDVQIEAVTQTSRFPRTENYLRETTSAASAAIPAMQHLSDEDRKRVLEAVTKDMQSTLEEFTQGNKVVTDWHAHIARAHRP